MQCPVQKPHKKRLVSAQIGKGLDPSIERAGVQATWTSHMSERIREIVSAGSPKAKLENERKPVMTIAYDELVDRSGKSIVVFEDDTIWIPGIGNEATGNGCL
jgi:hypothetical protein